MSEDTWMKHDSTAPQSAQGGLPYDQCPVGCKECSYDRNGFSAKFTATTLPEGCCLPGTSYSAHRILFLRSGSINIYMDRETDLDLSEGQCVFLARDRAARVMAQACSKLILLEFNNRIIFCNNDVLVNVAVRIGMAKSYSPVLDIVPELSQFFDNMEPTLSRIDIPCYHIVKEHELCLMMMSLYDKACIGGFFRDILRPKDDFTLFVQSSYLKVQTAGELAAMANMSEKTFTRRFKDTFHEPFHKWQVKQKAADIERAVSEGVVNNDELVRMFDFTSALAFYRFCQRYLHCTPTQLKEKYSSKWVESYF